MRIFFLLLGLFFLNVSCPTTKIKVEAARASDAAFNFAQWYKNPTNTNKLKVIKILSSLPNSAFSEKNFVDLPEWEQAVLFRMIPYFTNICKPEQYKKIKPKIDEIVHSVLKLDQSLSDPMQRSLDKSVNTVIKKNKVVKIPTRAIKNCTKRKISVK